MVNKTVKKCVHCQDEINLLKEKYVLLGTYQVKDILDESYFHMNCFKQYFNKKIEDKAKSLGNKGNSMDMMKNINGMVKALGGIENLPNLLGGVLGEKTDLQKILGQAPTKSKSKTKTKKKTTKKNVRKKKV